MRTQSRNRSRHSYYRPELFHPQGELSIIFRGLTISSGAPFASCRRGSNHCSTSSLPERKRCERPKDFRRKRSLLRRTSIEPTFRNWNEELPTLHSGCCTRSRRFLGYLFRALQRIPIEAVIERHCISGLKQRLLLPRLSVLDNSLHHPLNADPVCRPCLHH